MSEPCLSIHPAWSLHALSLILALAYTGLMVALWRAWRKTPAPRPPAPAEFPLVSILIAARNEAEVLPTCLEHIRQQQYPVDRLEVIVVDDHSEDGTASIVRQYPGVRYEMLSAGEYGKKAALTVGETVSRGQLLLFTDADCQPAPEWVKRMVTFQQHTGAVAVTGPVLIDPSFGWLEQFQALDFQSLMAVTAGGYHYDWFHLANGANLLVERQAFQAVGGYREGRQFESGDDVFLVQALVAAFPGKVHFLKQREAVVYTRPEVSWSGFWQQRLRWATKSMGYRERGIPLLWGGVFGYCLAILISVAMIPWFPSIFVILFGGKLVADYLVLRAVGRFFDQTRVLQHFFSAQGMHVLYVLRSGLAGLFRRTYVWKGRRMQ